MVLESEITIVDEIEIPEAFIRMRSDGIVHVFYKENTVLDVPLQLRMLDLYWKLTNNQKANFIFESDEGFFLTKEARENSVKLEASTPVIASALIVTNLASRIVANFFIKMNKPKIRYKLFGTVEEAAKWLKSL